jgi:hypothetical protein
VKQLHARNSVYDQILKKNEQVDVDLDNDNAMLKLGQHVQADTQGRGMRAK